MKAELQVGPAKDDDTVLLDVRENNKDNAEMMLKATKENSEQMEGKAASNTKKKQKKSKRKEKKSK